MVFNESVEFRRAQAWEKLGRFVRNIFFRFYLTSDAAFFLAQRALEDVDVVADEAPKDKQNDFLNYQLGQSNLMTTDTKNKILSTYHPLQSGVLQMKAFFELAWASFKDLV